MNVYTFSLPEGCDLQLKNCDASAWLRVTYEGQHLCTIDGFLLGEKVELRRKIGGTSFVIKSPNPVTYDDFRGVILESLSRHRDTAPLREALKPLEGMPIDPQTMEMIRSTAQESFFRTQERIHRREQDMAQMREYSRIVTSQTMSALVPTELRWTAGVDRSGYREELYGRIEVSSIGSAVRITGLS